MQRVPHKAAISWWKRTKKRRAKTLGPSPVVTVRYALQWTLRAPCLLTLPFWWWTEGPEASTSTSSNNSRCYKWGSTLCLSLSLASTTLKRPISWGRATRCPSNRWYQGCISNSSWLAWRPLQTCPVRRAPRSQSIASRSPRTASSKSRCNRTRSSSRSSQVGARPQILVHQPWLEILQGPRLVRDTIIMTPWWMIRTRMSSTSSTLMMCPFPKLEKRLLWGLSKRPRMSRKWGKSLNSNRHSLSESRSTSQKRLWPLGRSQQRMLLD